ncbi:hypothetical protein KAI65_00895 [Candidatus Parcubacteria bacterium]|nr:hypothetical protein [Candidatus Parcubacteria bacterium]
MEKNIKFEKALNKERSEELNRVIMIHNEYIGEFAMADNKEMQRLQELFTNEVAKLSPEDRKALDDFFDNLPESERPQNIALDY